jgi:L-lactate utilization protein LutB
MEDSWNWYKEKRAERTIKGLRSRGFQAEYFDSRQEASQWILDEAKDASFIGVGGSTTVRALGVLDALEEQGKTIFDHWKVSDPQEALRIRRAQLTCDLFLSSANAITESGEIVNMDGTGNRIAALAFGPRKVIIVAGINKIVNDIEQANRRIYEVASPLNAHRLGYKTPCVKTGQCSDCDSPQRICNATLVLHRKPSLVNMAVVLIGERLGY